MSFSWSTFALQAVNFVILVWLLKRFLFKPVSAIVTRRKEEIAHGMAEASAERQKALGLQRDLQAQRAGIEAERQKALQELRAQLAVERKSMLDETRAAADKIRIQATAQLAEERSAAEQDLYSRTIELAVNLAQRLLAELAIAPVAQAFLTRVLEYLDRLPADDRGALVSQLATNSLLVMTAHPLDARTQAQWREQLGKRIGPTGTIEFKSDPSLIAGVEITFPNAILRFSWRDTLNAIAKQMNHNEHAR
jgi:F-type H+-transporting ATPase subunit b